MAYEPMLYLMCVAFFMASGWFDVAGVFFLDAPAITTAWLAFLGFLFVLTIKLRKSPFDISMSHHAHQEIVRGVTTEMSGPTLGLVEVMHWCENVLFMGWVAMFFIWSNPLSIVLAVVVVLAVYFLEIWIDNNFARVKWQLMLKSAWAGRARRRRLERGRSGATCKEADLWHMQLEIALGHPLRWLRAATVATSRCWRRCARASTSSDSASSTPAIPSTPTSSSSPVA